MNPTRRTDLADASLAKMLRDRPRFDLTRRAPAWIVENHEPNKDPEHPRSKSFTDSAKALRYARNLNASRVTVWMRETDGTCRVYVRYPIQPDNGYLRS